jgi:hypothetical protein
VSIVVGDALVAVRGFGGGSFDGLLCDPPHGLGFQGAAWDAAVPGVGFWVEALRVLKPGAFGLVACSPRTQHRMLSRVEDAGFEVLDVISWVHAGGFPKSSDVSAGLDALLGVEREVVGVGRGQSGRALRGEGVFINDGFAWRGEFEVTRPGSVLARRWSDYGSRLKPAVEFWSLVRKPMSEGTVPRNVLRHDVGGLNIGGSRVPFVSVEEREAKVRKYEPGGRWPANFVHDGSEEVVGLFPEVRGGSAARFFYCAKASPRERGEGNDHSAVKPLALTRYLAGLILPAAGRVRRLLVPFAGSGSEVIGALQVGWEDVVGIEIDPRFAAIAERRVAEHVV